MGEQTQTICGKLDVSLLPDDVLKALARLELALERETDYREVRIDFKLRDESQRPAFHFLVDTE